MRILSSYGAFEGCSEEKSATDGISDNDGTLDGKIVRDGSSDSDGTDEGGVMEGAPGIPTVCT